MCNKYGVLLYSVLLLEGNSLKRSERECGCTQRYGDYKIWEHGREGLHGGEANDRVTERMNITLRLPNLELPVELIGAAVLEFWYSDFSSKDHICMGNIHFQYHAMLNFPLHKASEMLWQEFWIGTQTNVAIIPTPAFTNFVGDSRGIPSQRSTADASIINALFLGCIPLIFGVQRHLNIAHQGSNDTRDIHSFKKKKGCLGDAGSCVPGIAIWGISGRDYQIRNEISGCMVALRGKVFDMSRQFRLQHHPHPRGVIQIKDQGRDPEGLWYELGDMTAEVDWRQ
ncbi:hypothetical protein ARMGADRAFT_1029442 [Armillaria gallica]|uniref:Uncharacterized protein n=1 Tax=Armillaria gallica TaxID=47427 RepID=A0A2H3DS71_ARMGA|nr:hypothetical protein ARMGADRAFT_1029442 [Armillaria gallica]